MKYILLPLLALLFACVEESTTSDNEKLSDVRIEEEISVYISPTLDGGVGPRYSNHYNILDISGCYCRFTRFQEGGLLCFVLSCVGEDCDGYCQEPKPICVTNE